MKLWIFSDTHGSFRTPSIPEADVAVVAGDLGEGVEEAVEWLAEEIRPHMRVAFVPGNHEYYRRHLDTELLVGRRVAAARGIDLIDGNVVEIGGVAFAGATLWTDFNLHGEDRRRDAMEVASRGMNDHALISTGRAGVRRRFLPADAALRHVADVRFLASLRGRPGPLVVVTHHAPSALCLDPRFARDPLNPAFASHLDGVVRTLGANLWVHGHTHGNVDVPMGPTRIICNPHGYGTENPTFDPLLVVEIPGDAR